MQISGFVFAAAAPSSSFLGNRRIRAAHACPYVRPVFPSQFERPGRVTTPVCAAKKKKRAKPKKASAKTSAASKSKSQTGSSSSGRVAAGFGAASADAEPASDPVSAAELDVPSKTAQRKPLPVEVKAVSSSSAKSASGADQNVVASTKADPLPGNADVKAVKSPVEEEPVAGKEVDAVGKKGISVDGGAAPVEATSLDGPSSKDSAKATSARAPKPSEAESPGSSEVQVVESMPKGKKASGKGVAEKSEQVRPPPAEAKISPPPSTTTESGGAVPDLVPSAKKEARSAKAGAKENAKSGRDDGAAGVAGKKGASVGAGSKTVNAKKASTQSDQASEKPSTTGSSAGSTLKDQTVSRKQNITSVSKPNVEKQTEVAGSGRKQSETARKKKSVPKSDAKSSVDIAATGKTAIKGQSAKRGMKQPIKPRSSDKAVTAASAVGKGGMADGVALKSGKTSKLEAPSKDAVVSPPSGEITGSTSQKVAAGSASKGKTEALRTPPVRQGPPRDSPKDVVLDGSVSGSTQSKEARIQSDDMPGKAVVKGDSSDNARVGKGSERRGNVSESTSETRASSIGRAASSVTSDTSAPGSKLPKEVVESNSQPVAAAQSSQGIQAETLGSPPVQAEPVVSAVGESVTDDGSVESVTKAKNVEKESTSEGVKNVGKAEVTNPSVDEPKAQKVKGEAVAKQEKVPEAKSPASSRSTASPFAGMAAGPGSQKQSSESVLKPSSSTKGGILGKAKRPGPPAIPKKTAADFVAEGVVDDVDEDFAKFEEADIRFGIDDVKDPFKLGSAEGSAGASSLIESKKKPKEVEQEDDVKVETSVEGGGMIDITGDGGVLKKILNTGSGEIVREGAKVTVEYAGRLQDGKEFDSSRKRSGGFSFVLGEGSVIKGWEAGVATMKVGEKSELVCTSAYAYGRRGMPPVIPGSSTLTFEVEVVSVEGGAQDSGLMNVSEFNPEIARTPDDISRDYEERMKSQAERKANMSLLERFYIISPFASQTGERPPWYLNPTITFFIVFVVVGLSFYVVVSAGGVHQGYVNGPVDVNPFN